LLALWMFPAEMFVDLPTHVVDLPKVGHSIPVRHALREDAIMIAVMRNGDIFFDNDRVYSRAIRSDSPVGEEWIRVRCIYSRRCASKISECRGCS
jgi:hypothetical protein